MKLVVWGLQFGEESKGLDARVDAFEQMHPEIEVSVLSMGAGGMNPQKLMTAIVGNVPPDVIHQDRFTIGDWAARDTFRPLDDFIARDRDKPYGVREEDYYPACWKEANYTDPITGKRASSPSRTAPTTALLFYNKTLFRQAGIVDAKGEPKPPQTWDELLADEQEADEAQRRRHLRPDRLHPQLRQLLALHLLLAERRRVHVAGRPHLHHERRQERRGARLHGEDLRCARRRDEGRRLPVRLPGERARPVPDRQGRHEDRRQLGPEQHRPLRPGPRFRRRARARSRRPPAPRRAGSRTRRTRTSPGPAASRSPSRAARRIPRRPGSSSSG